MKVKPSADPDHIQQLRNEIQIEMANYLAHQWRQPLNVLALIIQNLQESSEYGELDKTIIRQSTEKSMELILGMSQSIEEYKTRLMPLERL